MWNSAKFKKRKAYPNLDSRLKSTPSAKICHPKSTGRSQRRPFEDSANSHNPESSPILTEMVCISKLFKYLIFQGK
jgi:hypothetical protein